VNLSRTLKIGNRCAAGARPLIPLGELTALPRLLSWWGGTGCSLTKNPTLLSALRVSGCGPSGLAEPVSRNEEIKIWSPY